MKEINWQTGNPPRSGNYLTTRLSKLKNSKPYIMFNTWKGLDFPNNKEPRWLTDVLDDSETIAWASDKDIEPYKGNM